MAAVCQTGFSKKNAFGPLHRENILIGGRDVCPKIKFETSPLTAELTAGSNFHNFRPSGTFLCIIVQNFKKIAQRTAELSLHTFKPTLPTAQQQCRQTHNFVLQNRDTLRRALEESALGQPIPPGTNGDTLFDTYGDIADRLAPLRTVRRRTDRRAPWFDADCRDARSVCRRYERCYQKSGSVIDRRQLCRTAPKYVTGHPRSKYVNQRPHWTVR